MPNGTVILDGDIIERVGAGIDPPRGANVIDAGGATVMPGMIDCHVHLYGKVAPVHERPRFPVEPAALPRREERPADAGLRLHGRARRGRLAAGIQDGDRGGAHPRAADADLRRRALADGRARRRDDAVRRAAALDERRGRRVAEDARRRAGRGAEGDRQLLRAGADFIKFHASGGVLSPTDEPTDTGFSPEEIAIMVYEARARGKTCMSHAQGTQGIKNAVLAGVESIEHCIYPDDETLAEMKARGTFLVPTLVAPVWALRYAERMPGSLHPQSIRKAGEVVDAHKEAFRRAMDAGVRIAFGTDQGVGPHGRNAEELEHMVEAGMRRCRRSSRSRRRRASACTWRTRSARSSPASSRTC